MLGDYTEIVDGKRVALEHLKSESVSEDDIFELQFTLLNELGFVFEGEVPGSSIYKHRVDPELKILYCYGTDFKIQYKNTETKLVVEMGMCLYDVVGYFLDGIRASWEKG